MRHIPLPYGKTNIEIHFNELKSNIDVFYPKEIHPFGDELSIIDKAIRNPLFNYGIPKHITKETRVAISINDKTRPVPNNLLFPPLLDALMEAGICKENILIIVAVGTHTPMPESEFQMLLDEKMIAQYKIITHNCDDESNLVFKGTTTRGTPVFVNKQYDEADIKIVVGDIEPHHFAGFSGGAKSASIGLCGRKTINHNHSFLQDPKSCVGRFEDNPLRQDIEEIGELIGIDLALNAILNEKKQILHVLFGKPQDVIESGIKIIRDTELTLIDKQYDLVIASAGGYPKDINLYQGQKALTHASLFCKNGGTVLLAIACEEGVGSQGHIDFLQDISNFSEARKKFEEKGFMVGPHKAIQFAAIADRINFQIKSEIDPSLMQKLLLQPIMNMQEAIDQIITSSPTRIDIAILPFATATIPQMRGE